jgi:hypothetical protein
MKIEDSILVMESIRRSNLASHFCYLSFLSMVEQLGTPPNISLTSNDFSTLTILGTIYLMTSYSVNLVEINHVSASKTTACGGRREKKVFFTEKMCVL